MEEFIQKKLRSAKVFRVCLIVLLVVTFASLISIGLVDDVDTLIFPTVISINALWISALVYLTLFMPFTGNIKWLKNKNLENVADDIILENPTLPRSKIYCGKKALFSKKPCAIIPYSEIAWVHLFVRKSYGITVEKAVIVYTKDGKKFSLNADAEEFKWLLGNYIVPHSPNVVIGYGEEQKARYKQLNPQSAEAEKKTKRIWGIVLMCGGTLFAIALLINIKTAEILPATIVSLGLFGVGAVLYIMGRKK